MGVVLFGPRLMQNVKPFSLKRVIQVYNLMMIVVNAYIFQQVCELNYYFKIEMLINYNVKSTANPGDYWLVLIYGW